MRHLLIAAWYVLACCRSGLAAGDDPKEMVRRAVQADARANAAARDYTCLEREELRTLSGGGATKNQTIQTWDVTPLEGSGYHRLVSRNDKPLTPQEEKQEQDRLRATLEQRRRETPEQRQRRIGEWERRRREQREHFAEVPDAFDFKLAGEETMGGVDVWVIDAAPHPGYRPKSNFAAYFSKMEGRIWISKKDYGWVKMEVETLDTISIGAFLIRLTKGSRLVMAQTRVNDEMWLPKRVTVIAGARVLLVKGYHFDAEYTFTGYRKFQAESPAAPEVR